MDQNLLLGIYFVPAGVWFIFLMLYTMYTFFDKNCTVQDTQLGIFWTFAAFGWPLVVVYYIVKTLVRILYHGYKGAIIAAGGKIKS